MTACDHMHVQLRHLVSERGDVELVAGGGASERARRCGDFTEQPYLRSFVKIDKFYGVDKARHEDHPRIVCIFGEQDARKRAGRRRERYPRRVADAATSASALNSWVYPQDSFGGKLAETRPGCLLSRIIRPI